MGRSSRVVAIANQKGGVGKTTTAVNLAASLAIAEQRVLLIDMDPQGNATSGLGHPHRRVERGTYEVLVGEASLPEVLVGTDLALLSLAPSSPDLAAASMELVDVGDRFTRLREALEAHRDAYDYVLIDCPPSLGLLTINALVAADAVLVPMQCEYYALEGLGDLTNTIERIRAGLNEALELHGVLLTMWDPRSNLSREVAQEVRKHFRVYDTTIPRNIRLAEAPSHGKPAILYDASSRGSHGYLNLARELLDESEAA
ncbi:MAG TPA: AAA family ATPase [Sandaracinaceae bacterium LLY-WYZ-13_1]|nr:AAA family ATPase [Sandaracinaceae bacterium LLY-WYZ-13_1]